MKKFGSVVAIATLASVCGLAGSAFAQCPGAPTVEADLGTILAGTPIATSTTLVTNEVHWFKFTLAAPVQMSALTFLNFDTAGASADTELGVYDCAGNLKATDDDDSTGLQSALSFGSGNAVQQGDGTAVWSNGRDGALAAGDYYLAAVRFNATFGLTGFTVTSTATTGGSCPINVLMDTATAQADPAGTINLGTLGAGSQIVRTNDPLAANQVQWYKVTIPAANNAAGTFIDMDTEGSILSPANTTRIAVYNVTGAITGTLNATTKLNVTTGLTDAADGTDTLSQISLGIGTRPAPGNGVAYNGRDGDLQGGTYLIGIAGPGTAPTGVSPTTGGNFGFTSTSANAGTINFRIASAAPALAVAGNAVTGAELSTVLLTANVALGPGSTNPSVTANLASIGGSSTQQFYDDGTHGDAVAGDLVFSYSYSLPGTVPAAAYPIALTASDAQAHSASGSLALTVTAGPGGACCAGTSCSLASNVACNVLGGNWQGAGTNCGDASFTPQLGTAPFIDISTTGAVLATVSNVDDGGQTVTLPFAFNYLNTVYNDVWVCSNGFLQFGATHSTTFTNVAIPNAAQPNNMLAVLWDDYDLVDARNGPGLGNVYYLDESATNGRVIISWQGVGQYNLANAPLDANDFQAILYSNGNVEFRYGLVPTILAPQVANDIVTIGYENVDGTTGLNLDPNMVANGNASEFLTATPGVNPCSQTCDSIDFNNDGLFPDTADIDDFLAVFAGQNCPSTGTICNTDIDFNNDGLFPDTLDIDALLSVFAGQACLR